METNLAISFLPFVEPSSLDLIINSSYLIISKQSLILSTVLLRRIFISQQ